jgi:MFS transporter, SP family, arabinose:H+ symporter
MCYSKSFCKDQGLVGITFICLTAAIGGLLFGFDTAVISGTIAAVKKLFVLDAASEGWFVSSGLLGCIIGVFITSLLTDWIGRRKVMLASGVMFLLSGIGCAFAGSFALLVLSRLLGGIGVGMASVVSPMYIAEFAPANLRGRMVAFYQLAITIGILLAYFSNALLLGLSQQHMSNSFAQWFFCQEFWRPMFLVMSIPSAFFTLMLLRVPESPRWLYAKNRESEAAEILVSLKGQETADSELSAMASSRQYKAAGERKLSDASLRMPLLIGITLAILQQFCGINAIIYYGPRIFESAGIAGGSAFTFQVIIGFVNMLFTFVAIKYADQFGRRALMLCGLTGIIVSLLACGIMFYANITNAVLLLSLILLFIACFALSLGPITWIMINEIFPTDVRGKAVSLCTFTLWLAVWLLGQFLPWLLETAGPAVTFWIFAFFSMVNFFFCLFVVKETKNKTLEEVEQMFISPH